MFLETAFGSRAKVKVLRALATDPRGRMTEAELARAVGMSPNTVNLAVLELEGARLVDREGAARGGSVRLATRAALGRAIADLFREEAGLLARLRRSVRPLVGSRATCVLFGSVARGEEGPGSDLDLAIVAPTHDRAADIAVDVADAARRVLPLPPRFLLYTPAEVRARWDTPLLQALRREGVLLGGKPLEAWR